MNRGIKRTSVALLALPQASASVTYGMYDIFASVGRDWGLVVSGVPGPSLMVPQVVATSRFPVVGANDVRIQPDAAVDEIPVPDLICVPDLLIPPTAPLDARFDPALDWLRRCHQAGTVIASACSGAMVLAAAGLLNGREATAHWAYCDALRRAYPEVRIRCNQVIVPTGDGHRIVTAGGGASFLDLALFLIARFCGQEEAMRIARLYLIDWHADGQLPFALLSQTRQTDDRAIADCQEWIATHYTTPAPVSAMVAMSGLNERSFKRRFQNATGMSPMRYVHALRIEEAKQALETSDAAIEAVALDLGYEDSSFFRRLFAREVGMSPAQYRRKFRNMRRGLAPPPGGEGAIAAQEPAR